MIWNIYELMFGPWFKLFEELSINFDFLQTVFLILLIILVVKTILSSCLKPSYYINKKNY